MKFFLLLLTVFVSGCSQSVCNRWEYAIFSFSTYSVIENDELVEVDSNVLWVTGESSAFFKNNKLMLKDSEKSLSTFFGASSNHPVSILTELGKDGWEVYDYESYHADANSEKRDWQLKRCI